jgi:hypothetical protein
MKIDNELIENLIRKAQFYQEQVPIFQIKQIPLPILEKDAEDFARRFVEYCGMKESKMSTMKKPNRTILQFPEGIKLKVYHASGAMIMDRGWNPLQNIISEKVEKVEKDLFIKQSQEAINNLKLDRSGKNEELRFERLWQIKASGMTKEGKQGNITLARTVGAFRRYLNDLPVWGRASVFIKLASEGQVDSWGLDWRNVCDKPIDEVETLNPDDGAKKIMEEFQTTLPNISFTLEDFEPELFAMGYFSQPKRRAQTIMQPVWIAMFRAKGWTTLNHLIVVPALRVPYEPICRIVKHLPSEETRPLPKQTKQAKR